MPNLPGATAMMPPPTPAIVNTFEIGWIETSVLTLPATDAFPSLPTTAMPNRFSGPYISQRLH